MLGSIVRTLTFMNWEYGRGDILGVVMDEDWTGGVVTRKCFGCESEKVRFAYSLETGVVRFAGHRKVVKQEGVRNGS